MDKGLNLYSKYRSFSQTYKVCLYQSITNCMFILCTVCYLVCAKWVFKKKKKKYKSFKEMDSATTCFPSLPPVKMSRQFTVTMLIIYI